MEEILSSTKCASMRIRFHLLDGQFIAMPADSYTTVGEVFNDLADRLEIGKDQGFVLYEYFGGLERGLSHTEKFSDIVAKWEKFQKDNAFDRSLRKEQVRFLIKKRLYLNTGGLTAKGKSEKEEMLLRAQAVWEIKHDLYPLTDSQAVYLTALLIHSVCGKRGGGGASDEPIK